MGTYSALGPLIKQTVENLKGEEKKDLEQVLHSPPGSVLRRGIVEKSKTGK